MSLARGKCAWLIVPIIALFLLSACGGAGSTPGAPLPGVINVVAAENFYGDIVKQLGGSHVSVTSILSDPNVDSHEYESSFQDARRVSTAQLVIANGGGYDNWIDRLLSASPSSRRVVLKAFDIARVRLPYNVHVWYSFDNAQAIARAIAAALKQLDAASADVFDSNLQVFDRSLQQLQQKIGAIKKKYAGTPVGLTETIYLYQTGPEGLNVLTPFEFEKAIAEGNDPPVDTVATANNQINNHQIKVLIYNKQTITPLTTNLQNAARAKYIPIVPVTETMPPGKTYQTWMLDQLNALEAALGG